MPYETKIANVVALAMCNSIVDLVDAGGGPGVLVIYDGIQPDNPDTPVDVQQDLATIQLEEPAFGAALDASPGATAVANIVTALKDLSAENTGTATWFRVYNSLAVGIFDGTVGTSDADLIMPTVDIYQFQPVEITQLHFTIPEG